MAGGGREFDEPKPDASPGVTLRRIRWDSPVCERSENRPRENNGQCGREHASPRRRSLHLLR